MKVAVTGAGPDLDAQVDPSFGRTQHFLIVDSDSLEFEAVQNPNVAAGSGAGIQTSQIVADLGVEAVVTGNCGPNAHRALSAAGIKVYIGATGSVRQAIEAFLRGELQDVTAPSAGADSGAGGAAG